MHKFWAWLGLNLGKHAGVVSIVGLIITIVLGAGITRLEFATGQDSYLNKGEEVYKDSVAYQDLFGGQAMVTLVTLGEGRTVTDLFTPGGVEPWEQVEADIKNEAATRSSPSSRRSPPSSSPTPRAPAPATCGGGRRPDPARAEDDPPRRGKAARSASSAETLARVDAIPTGDREIGNAGVERLPPPRQRGRDPQVVAAVLPERAPTPRWSSASPATSTSRPRARPPSSCRTSPPTSSSATPPSAPPAPRCSSATSTTTSPAACWCSVPSRWGSW